MAMTAECLRTDVALVILVTGRLDGETAPELQRIFNDEIAATDRNMILDFTGVRYLSSAGLSTVLQAGKAISRQGGQLRMCGLDGRLSQMFALTGFDSLFESFDTQEAALADCRLKTQRV